MNYKETLFFVAQCLTITLDKKNRILIEKRLKTKNIDWKAVVKLSTTHYVLPALYCNLKRSDFLIYLPKDLVAYMRYITNLNKERNKKIINQVKELNNQLLEKNITPLFIKGAGNLFAHMYENIAERMIGDIDFIFSKKDYSKAIRILREFGYSEVEKRKYYYFVTKHYRRLIKDNNIAAIEIHKELITEKYIKNFNYKFVSVDSQIIQDINVLSYANKLNLSIISGQINDNDFYYKSISLKNAYDVFLLSKKTSAKSAVNLSNKLSYPLNCFLAACYEVFNKVESLNYNKSTKTSSYLEVFKNQLINRKKTLRMYKYITSYLYLKKRLNILCKSLVDKSYRVWLFNRLSDKNWYKEKLIRLGLKK